MDISKGLSIQNSPGNKIAVWIGPLHNVDIRSFSNEIIDEKIELYGRENVLLENEFCVVFDCLL